MIEIILKICAFKYATEKRDYLLDTLYEFMEIFLYASSNNHFCYPCKSLANVEGRETDVLRECGGYYTKQRYV